MRNAHFVLAQLLLTAAVMAPLAVAVPPAFNNGPAPANPFSQNVPRQAVYMNVGESPAPPEWNASMTESDWIGPPQPVESYVAPQPNLQQCGPQCGSGRRFGNLRNLTIPGYSLPAGRRYYNGRYFGNFNNRFYGPQYGYF